MLITFLATLEQMIRIFLFLAVGYSLNRLHIVPKGASVGISKLVTMVFLPALLIHSNMTEFSLAEIGDYGQLILLGGFLWALITLLSVPVAKMFAKANMQERGIFLYSLSFPNSGAVGTPLCLAFMGSAGLFQLNLFALPMSIMTYAWGVELFMEMERKNPVKRFLVHLFNPTFISLAIGLFLGAIGARNWVPDLVVDVLGDFRDCYVPVSLILSGYVIAEYPLKEAFYYRKGYVYALLRLFVIPGLVLLVVWLMGCSKTVATLALLFFAGPCGMNVVVFPAAYGQDCKTGASLVLLSSMGSLLSVPILYAILQQIFK